MKDKFIEFEKKITELTEELMSNHQTINLKDRDIEEVKRRLNQAEDDFNFKTRSTKNTIEEQLHNAKMQHASELKNQQDEIRQLRDALSKLEERLKTAMMSEQNKERLIIEFERKYAELNDKLNNVTGQLKIERESNDRLCLDNEDIKRKFNKEEARCRKAIEDLKEYEDESKITIEKPKHTKNIREEKEPEPLVKIVSDENDTKKINILTKKVRDLKEKLKFASDKLVKTISDKVHLIQKLRDHGISLNDLDKPSKPRLDDPVRIIDQTAYENQTKHSLDHHQGTPGCPVHGKTPNHLHIHAPLQQHHHNTEGQFYDTQFNTDIIPYLSQDNFNYAPISHESKSMPGSLAQSPYSKNGFESGQTTQVPVRGHTHGDHYLVDQRTYHANASDLTEEELQLKIRHLLNQKETFFQNA